MGLNLASQASSTGIRCSHDLLQTALSPAGVLQSSSLVGPRLRIDLLAPRSTLAAVPQLGSRKRRWTRLARTVRPLVCRHAANTPATTAAAAVDHSRWKPSRSRSRNRSRRRRRRRRSRCRRRRRRRRCRRSRCWCRDWRLRSHAACRHDRFLHRDWASWPNPGDRSRPLTFRMCSTKSSTSVISSFSIKKQSSLQQCNQQLHGYWSCCQRSVADNLHRPFFSLTTQRWIAGY